MLVEYEHAVALIPQAILAQMLRHRVWVKGNSKTIKAALAWVDAQSSGLVLMIRTEDGLSRECQLARKCQLAFEREEDLALFLLSNQAGR